MKRCRLLQKKALWHAYQREAGNILHKWRRLVQHKQMIRQMDLIAQNHYQHLLKCHTFKRWKAKNRNWHELFHQRHVLPVTYWGMQLSRNVMRAWKQYVVDQKTLNIRIKEATASRQKSFALEGIALCISVFNVLNIELIIISI